MPQLNGVKPNICLPSLSLCVPGGRYVTCMLSISELS